MRARLILPLVLVVAAIGGCRARDTDPGPGGVTVGEARELDEAADKLEQRPQAPAPDPPTPDPPGTNPSASGG